MCKLVPKLNFRDFPVHIFLVVIGLSEQRTEGLNEPEILYRKVLYNLDKLLRQGILLKRYFMTLL